jgi:hypothetical protein
MSTFYSGTGVQPAQAVEFSPDEYRKNMQFLSAMWNRKLYSFGSDATSATVGSDDNRYVTSYLMNCQYFFGRQTASDYGFFIQDELGQNTRFPMTRGMDITKILLHIDGVVRQMIEPLPKTINVTAYSKNAVSQKKELMDFIKLKAQQKVFFDLIEEATGVGFKPIDRDFKTQEELDKYLEDFQESMEIAYQNIAKHILLTNRYMPTLAKFSQYVALGGQATIEVYEHGGMIKWRIVPPESAIVDMSKNDDQHEDDDYGGSIMAMSVPDLLDEFDWTEDEVEELQTMAKAQTMWAQYNTYVGVNGLVWWQLNNGVPKVMVVRGQWRSLEKMDGEWVEVLREGVYIGNKYLKNCKISEGQVWNKMDKTRKRLRFRTVTPNTVLGNNLGIVGMLKRYQDIKDAFATKMIELSSRAVGKSFIVNASKLPEGLTAPDVISQLKQSNMIVLEGADIDETPDSKRQNLVETLDWTLDPNVRYYMDMISYYDGVISDIINIPQQTRGFQAQYQSAAVVNSNLQQSTLGMSWYYKNIMTSIKNLLEFSSDYAKLILPEKEDSDLNLVIGDAMVEVLKLEDIKKMQFEDFLLELNPNGLLQEQEKEQLKQFAAALAQNGAMSVSNYIKMLQIDNKTQMYNYFEKVEKEKQIREEQMQQAQMEAQMAQAEMQQQGKQNVAEINAEAGLAKQEMQQMPPQMLEQMQ